MYGKIYTDMAIKDQKSFTVHHHWLTVKFLAVSGIYPYINIMFRGKALTDPAVPGSSISNADWLSVLYLGIIARCVRSLSCVLKPGSMQTADPMNHVASYGRSRPAWPSRPCPSFTTLRP